MTENRSNKLRERESPMAPYDDGNYNGPAIFPFKIKYEVEWPRDYEFEGAVYYYTGNLGKRRKDNCPCAEFEELNRYGRIYLCLDGKVEK